MASVATAENINAIFRSGHEACRFAYAFSGQQYPLSVMAKIMQCIVIGSGRGLIGLDGAANAGTVKRHVEAMPMPNPLAIAARCEIDYEKSRQYAAMLVDSVIPTLGTGGHHRHLVKALIWLYFRIPGEDNQPVKLSSLCDRFQVSADTMTRRKSAAFRRLREIESKAQGMIDDALKDAGVVE